MTTKKAKPRKQTRRSIDLREGTYLRVKTYCDSQQISCSGYLEVLIAEDLDTKSVFDPGARAETGAERDEVDVRQLVRDHFTF